MMADTIAYFEDLLKTVPARLADLAGDAAAQKPAADRW